MNKSTSYKVKLYESLLDAEEASEYLNAALEDSQAAFLKALKNVAQARQMADVAKEAGIRRETLYRAFSSEGNPTIATLTSVLNTLGMKIQIAAEKQTVQVRH